MPVKFGVTNSAGVSVVLRFLKQISHPINRCRMSAWSAKIESIILKEPGNDEEFEPDEIETFPTPCFEKMSTWNIACEEVLDTCFPAIYFQRAFEELASRGVSPSKYRELRRFAWLTAGWLNFEMQLWDWCSLDEKDIRLAINWQRKDGWISESRKRELLQFFEEVETLTKGSTRIPSESLSIQP